MSKKFKVGNKYKLYNKYGSFDVKVIYRQTKWICLEDNSGQPKKYRLLKDDAGYEYVEDAILGFLYISVDLIE